MEELLLERRKRIMRYLEAIPKIKRDITSQEAEEKEETYVANLNPNLRDLSDDYLYHINLGKTSSNLVETFKDVKFICMGGSASRMHEFAYYIKDLIGFKVPFGFDLKNLCEPSDRYALFKVGPVISVNHGMGCPSVSILLHELIKLVHYAKAKDVTFFRIGTCGGLGVKPGTVVLTNEAVDGLFRPEYRLMILGKEKVRQTKCSLEVIEKMEKIGKECAQRGEVGDVVSGKTLCAHDFYEGQGRVDGAFCEYTPEEKKNFLKECRAHGVTNIEMESLCFTGMLSHAGLKAAVACVTLLDRLNDDQVTLTHEQHLDYQQRPFRLVGEYIKQSLAAENNKN